MICNPINPLPRLTEVRVRIRGRVGGENSIYVHPSSIKFTLKLRFQKKTMSHQGPMKLNCLSVVPRN